MNAGRRAAVQAGFTLVEVLVALLVMALMAGMAWQGVAGVMRARDATQSRLEQTLRLNTVIAQWDQDLASLQEDAAVPALQFDGATLRLTRRTNDGLQIVAWALHPEIGSGGTWMRWAGPPVVTEAELQDQWFRSQQFQGVEPGQMRAIQGISQWQVYYYRGNAWTNAQSSGDTALVPDAAEPPAQQPSAPALSASGASPRALLPTGVRMVLTFAEGSGYNGSLVRDVALGPQWN